MLSIQGLSYYIADRAIYEQAHLHIGERDRIGLIGQNGAGKSTLLRLLAGEYQPHAGQIVYPTHCSIGFLHQDQLSYHSEQSIKEITLEAFDEVVELERKIKQISHILNQSYSEELLQELLQYQSRFESLEGYRLPAKAEAILEGLGFQTSDLDRPLSQFSGGWRMRVMLAKLLLKQPQLLLLDEPTNHLDLPSIQWLEQYLQQYKGALIVVSHDRTFLNRIVNRIVEVEQGKLHNYPGNYDDYQLAKSNRYAQAIAAYENQQERIRQMEQFINRFRAKATKARQVQSKLKQLERMERIDAPTTQQATIKLHFPVRRQPGKELLSLRELSKSYGHLRILNNAQATIWRGDRIALIGANGRGKSTLLRIVAGIEPFEGERHVGYQVDIAYYAQHQIETLNPQHSLLEALSHSCPHKSEAQLRSLLGGFLFHGDDVFKKISVLSGGERARVALAKILASEANLLLLDEPTNHLDISSVDVLTQALQDYEGSYLLVSHDRHFLQSVANKIWYISHGKIHEFLGGYQEFEEWQQTQSQEINHTTTNKNNPKEPSAPSDNLLRRQQVKDLQREEKRIQKHIEKLESQILDLEDQKKAIENDMATEDFFSNTTQALQSQQHYEQLQQELLRLHKQWEEHIEALEQLQQKLSQLRS